MLNTRANRVSATVFHKHKYISNINVTPADAVIAEAGNLASVMKDKIPVCLQQYPLRELMRLSESFSDVADSPYFLSTKPYPCADATHQPFSQQIPSENNKNYHIEFTTRPPTRAPARPPTTLPLFSPRVKPILIAPRLEPSRRSTMEIKHSRISQLIPIDPRLEPPRRYPRFATNAKYSRLDGPAQRTRS